MTAFLLTLAAFAATLLKVAAWAAALWMIYWILK